MEDRQSCLSIQTGGIACPPIPEFTYNPRAVTLSMSGKHDSTEVVIFGQTYNVRGEGDPNYLTELAQFVDARMREVAAEVATVDPMKIAILAALNIADEFSRFRKQRESGGDWIERTEEISERLSKVIS
jgi:cell division protein ZapA